MDQQRKTMQSGIVLQPVSANQCENDAYHLTMLCGMVKLAQSPQLVRLDDILSRMTVIAGDAPEFAPRRQANDAH